MKTSLKNFSVIVCATALSGLLPALAAEPTHQDKSFVTDAAEGGLAEVQMGELAKSKAQSPAAKKLGEMLVTDHTKANAELKTIAESKNIEVPTSPSMVQQGKLKLLKMKKDGAEFDKAFADEAVSDHKTDIKNFEKAAKELNDADLKAFAQKTLPTLRTHLEHAQEAQSK